MKKPNNFLLWIYYNNAGKISIGDCSTGELYTKYKIAIDGDHRYCRCIDGSMAVNLYWDEFHCTYCLKQVKRK